MKKATALLLLAVLIATAMLAMTACNSAHKHNLKHFAATAATPLFRGVR